MLEKLRQNKPIWRRLVMLAAFLAMATLISFLFAVSHDRQGCLANGCTYWDDVKVALPIAYTWAACLWAFYGLLGGAIYLVGIAHKRIFK